MLLCDARARNVAINLWDGGIMSQFLWAYPVATISTAALYALLILLAFPASRRVIVPWLAPTPPHQQYLQSFDTFRGFAAVLVAIGHCWWASYPVFAITQYEHLPFLAYDSKAVPMFAVLSGFLIYRSVLTIKSLDELRAYVVRRFFRIYPTYLLSVVLCVITAQYVAGDHYSAKGFFFSDLFMLKVFNRPGGQANPVTWSLFIEVAFYAFLPLYVLTLGRRRVIMVSAIAIVGMIIAEYPSREFGLWKFFLMGILASELSQTDAFKEKFVATVSLLVALALLIYDFGGPDHDWMAHLGLNTLRWDYETLALGLGCSLLLAALPHVKSAAATLEILPLRIIGMTSYSLYVTHFFYILANFPEVERFANAGTPPMYEHFKTLPMMPWWYLPFVFFPGCITWAIVSYVLVERPGIRLGSALLKRRARAAAGLVAQPAE
jgi:peptidoglycan/LPS O-acetylase OafA/YrhL